MTIALAGCAPAPLDPIVVDPQSSTLSLVGYWSFDDGPGSTTVKDGSVWGRNGTIVGGHSWPSGPPGFGSALAFDGTGEVSVPEFQRPGGQSWSITAWVRPDPSIDTGLTYAAIVSNEWLRTGGWELNLQYPNPDKYPNQDNVYQFGYWIGPDANAYTYWNCKCVSTTDWTHLAAVLDRHAGTLSFYRNGVLDGSVAATEDPPVIKDGDSTLYMGRWPPRSSQIAVTLMLQPEERRFVGAIDDVAIYNRALGPSEVADRARKPIQPAP